MDDPSLPQTLFRSRTIGAWALAIGELQSPERAADFAREHCFLFTDDACAPAAARLIPKMRAQDALDPRYAGASLFGLALREGAGKIYKMLVRTFPLDSHSAAALLKTCSWRKDARAWELTAPLAGLCAEQSQSLLLQCAHDGFCEGAAWLLNEGCDPGASLFFNYTEWTCSALHLACSEGRPACVRLLLQAGADPDALSSLRQTPEQRARELLDNPCARNGRKQDIQDCLDALRVFREHKKLASACPEPAPSTESRKPSL